MQDEMLHDNESFHEPLETGERGNRRSGGSPEHHRQPPQPSFRQGVAAVVLDSQLRILVCERLNPLDSWQFVQGGISPGESEEEALIRELGEEIGVFPHDVQILACVLPRFRYTLRRTSRQYKNKGQEHRYYVVQVADHARLNLVADRKPEFRSARFVRAGEFPFEKVFEKKRCIYWDVLSMLEPLIGTLTVPRPVLYPPEPPKEVKPTPIDNEPSTPATSAETPPSSVPAAEAPVLETPTQSAAETETPNVDPPAPVEPVAAPAEPAATPVPSDVAPDTD